MNRMYTLLLFCTLYAILNVAGASIIKWNLKTKQLSVFSDWVQFLLQPSVLLAFSLIFFSALSMFKALSNGNFSSTVPIATGINFIFTIAIGSLLFKEIINI